MSVEVQVIAPESTLRQAAQMMLELDVGALPVRRGTSLLGTVTDRDMTIYALEDFLAAVHFAPDGEALVRRAAGRIARY